MESSAQPVALSPSKPLAVVIPFPLPVRSCFSCAHWRGLNDGAVSWCDSYRQTIDHEALEAQDCLAYDRCEEGSQEIVMEDEA